ncbi:hypothetical protein BDR04DRAFT_1117886 [Suillus decipiens]|nr:hypothetical protein BDR04DRAFT_1117886 [Suillus decipiens]
MHNVLTIDPIIIQERQYASLASFLILTLLLPDLVILTERNIRIVDPFYAAAGPSYAATFTPPPTSHFSTKKASATFKWSFSPAILQYLLHALPSGGQIPGQTTPPSTS